MTNELIMEYSNYIYGLIKYFNGYKNKDDLYQAGWIGLIMAYKKYDPNMGAKFTTYAFSFILGEMYKLVREDKGIKISRSISSLNLKIEKATILLSQKLMRYPTLGEIATFLGVDVSVIEESIRASQIISSIDEAINDDGKDITLHDKIGSNGLDLDTLVALKQELLNLSEEERKIITNCLIENKNQEEVAKDMGISQVQVSRKLTKVKNKIKYNLVA